MLGRFGGGLGLGLVRPVTDGPTATPFYGLDFDLDDYATAGGTDDFNPGTGSFAIECYFRTTSTPSTRSALVAVGGSGTQAALLPAIAGTNYEITIEDDNGHQVQGYTGSYTLNTWTHTVCVINRSTQKSYMIADGVQQAELSIAALTGAINCTGGLQFARDNGGGMQHPVDLCCVRVYNRVITAAEAQVLRYDPWMQLSGLIAHYPMLPGSGQELKDISGNALDGQLGSTSGEDTNDPTWIGPYTKLMIGGPA